MNDEHRNDWFLAQIKPNSHQIAERNLKRQGFEMFLPMQEETWRDKGRFINKLKPLFPGYLFVSLDLTRGGWRIVNSTYGISRLVSFSDRPSSVPTELISQLMLRCDASGKLLPPSMLKPGDKVSFIKGPFVDLAAVIETLSPEKRVWVLLDLMGQQTRLAVPDDQLRVVYQS